MPHYHNSESMPVTTESSRVRAPKALAQFKRNQSSAFCQRHPSYKAQSIATSVSSFFTAQAVNNAAQEGAWDPTRRPSHEKMAHVTDRRRFYFLPLARRRCGEGGLRRGIAIQPLFIREVFRPSWCVPLVGFWFGCASCGAQECEENKRGLDWNWFRVCSSSWNARYTLRFAL